jgi:3'-phosphoadenosine 5'-phosphosulfate sulfotransferase (PAPS reductase)/FAD synthetase
MDDDLRLKDYAFDQRKNLPYEIKLLLTKQRIQDWSEHWQRDVYVSFSGGLDSTVLLHLVREVLGASIPAVFVDTGLEYPALVKFVGTFDNVAILKPKMTFNKVVEKYGYPVISKETAAKVRKLRTGNLCERYRNYLLNGDQRGKLGKLADKWKFLVDADFNTSEKCCNVMKKEPLRKYHKETGRYAFVGITQDESRTRKRQYEKTGCNVYDAGDPISKAMGFWNRQDVLTYAVENNLKIASVYGEIIKTKQGWYKTTGEQRTGCIFCGFGIHLEVRPHRFDRLKILEPKLYDYCLRGGKYDDKGNWIPCNGLGMKKILIDIKVMDKSDDYQIDMFGGGV